MTEDIRHRDKVVRNMTLRQSWPRNMARELDPAWSELPSRAPFPSNLKYGRPRSLDHTPPETVPPPEGRQNIFAGPPLGDPAPTSGVEKFRTHKELDDYLYESDKPIPEVWHTLTVQQKKDYLRDD